MVQKTENSLKIFQNIHTKKGQEIKGPKSVSVAVLGAFDTWVLMHEISVILARLGYTARTSLYTYIFKDKSSHKYYRDPNPDSEESMTEYLRDNLLGNSDKAVIVYTVPAAHYNEAEWLHQLEKETLGIALVRKIDGIGLCRDYVLEKKLGYGYCIGTDTAWECIKKNPCPFKSQEIAKNQIEYFTVLSKDKLNKMKLICIERMSNLEKILELFLTEKLEWPIKHPYIFEFRIPLSPKESTYLKNKLNENISGSEDRLLETYTYEDFYYLQSNIDEKKWKDGHKTIRIRRDLNTSGDAVNVIMSKIKRDDNGFVTKYPFGSKTIWKANLEDAKEFLNDMSMKNFLNIRKKEGLQYRLIDPIICDIYIEKIFREEKGKYTEKGQFAEIEFWIDEPENEALISMNIEIIKKYLEIKEELINMPVQQLFY